MDNKIIRSNEMVHPRGELSYSVLKDGEIIKYATISNLVVTQGRTNLLKLFGGHADGKAITKVGVGTGNSAPSLPDTAITNGFVKSIGGVSYPTATSITFSFNIASGEANGKNIKEFALFNSDDLLCARVVDSAGIEKTASIAIDGTWTIKLL